MSSLSSYKDGSLGSAFGLLNERAYSDGSLGQLNDSAYLDGSLGLNAVTKQAAAAKQKRGGLRGLGCGCGTGASSTIVDTSSSLKNGILIATAAGLGLFLLLKFRTA